MGVDEEESADVVVDKAPQSVEIALVIPVPVKELVKQAEEEMIPLPEAIMDISVEQTDLDVVPGVQEQVLIESATPSAEADQEQKMSQLEEDAHTPEEEITVSATKATTASTTEDMTASATEDTAHPTDMNVGDEHISLSATQVWTRSKGSLRDDTARARGEFSTPSAKAKAAKCAFSPGTELEHLTPSFLKRIFTVLNDNMVVTPRRTSGAASSSASPMKREANTSAGEEVDSNQVITTAKVADIVEAGDVETEEPIEAAINLPDGEADVPPTEFPSSEQVLVAPAPTHLFEDDTRILLDFVSRSELKKARKAANIAKRSSLANRRDSNAIKAALASPSKQPQALEGAALPPISISSVLAQATEEVMPEPTDFLSTENAVLSEDIDVNAQVTVQEVSTAEANCSRRSTRIPKQATKNVITITRTDGQDLRVLKDAESRALALSTRANTRRNKGTSVSVPDMLKKLTAIVMVEPISAEQAEEERPSRLRWKDELAQYCEIEAREYSTDAGARADEVAEVPAVTVQISIQGVKTILRPRKVARPAVRRTKSVPVTKEQNQVAADKPATPASASPVAEEPVRRTPLVRSRSAPVVVKRTAEPARTTTPAAVKDTKIVMPAAATVTSEITTTSLRPAPTAPNARPRRLPQPVRSRNKTPVTTNTIVGIASSTGRKQSSR